MVNYIARHERITGTDLSGTSGDANRTYTLANTGAVSAMFTVVVQGAILHQTDDYALASDILTFINPVYDDQIISIDYLTTTSAAATGSLKYTSTVQLAAVTNISSDIPAFEVGVTPTYELIGTGDNSATTFYFDHNNVLGGSYILYKGATAATATALTETTHYTVTKDAGKIVLTAAGVTLVATNNIYAEYSYCNINLKDSFLETTLLRAETEVDNMLGTTFTDGTADNPAYPYIVDEYQASKGRFDKAYFTRERPLIDIKTGLVGDITALSTSLTVTTGHGVKLPSTGYVYIDTEAISYTGITSDTLTGLTRGVLDTTAAAHSSGADIHTTIVMVSGTDEGGTPSWYPLTHGSEVRVEDNGKVYIYDDTLYSNLLIGNNMLYKQGVPARFRICYYYGWDTIPVDITRLTLLLAQQQLFSDTIFSSLIKGRNEFRPELLDVAQEEIDRIVGYYQNIDMRNT